MSSNFGVYLIGFIIVIIGLAYGAYLLGAPPVWIGVGVIILVGLAILRGVTKTQTKAPSPPPR
jgi:hypothetical protein